MRIVLDLQACQSDSRFRGIGRYSMSLSKEMARQAGNHEIWIALNDRLQDTVPNVRHNFDGLIPKDHIVTFSVPGQIANMGDQNRWRVHAADVIREYFFAGLSPDIVHISTLFEGTYQDVVSSIGVFAQDTISSVTLYDLIPLALPDKYLPTQYAKEFYFKKLEYLKRSKCLLAISEYTRQEAIRLLGLSPDSIVNIGAAVDDSFRPQKISPEEKKNLQEKYAFGKSIVLCSPGGFDERKNIPNLIAAYSKLTPDLRKTHQLMITSHITDPEAEAIYRLAKKQGLGSDEIVLSGYVPNKDLIALYNICELFVFPSLYEGFGLPALEAMACGAPVIGSNTTSIPEVVGRTDALFDPASPQTITEKIQYVLTNEGYRQSLREHGPVHAKKFSWKNSASRALESFEAVHKQTLRKSQPSVPKPKPRLAFFSPLPPEKSGISYYSAELLPELASFYDITLITDQIANKDSSLTEKFPIKDINWFESHADSFDRRLYQLGNSPFHKHMFTMLNRYPGVIVLHDFYLSNAFHWMEASGYLPDFFTDALFSSHGYAALLTLQHQGPEATVRMYPCSKSPMDQADGIIVHSQSAINETQKWYGAQMTSKIWCLPQLRSLPQNLNREQAKVRLGFKSDDFLVCSFGLIAPTKLNSRLLDAWAESLLMQDKHCHLVFVGENDDSEYGRTLLDHISKPEFKSNVHLTGFISSKLYNQYLEAADVAVQLRLFSRGETSRSVLDAMAYGVPLIINAHGTMAEYPDNILIKLPNDFTGAMLTNALERMWKDPAFRVQIGKSSRQYIAEFHSPEKICEEYQAAIEHFAKVGQSNRYKTLLNSLANLASSAEPSETDLIMAAEAIAINTLQERPRQILVDISILAKQDLKTGIERVTRSILLELLNFPPDGFHVEPVYCDNGIYRYARRFTIEFLGIDRISLSDDIIDVQRGDVFLGLEWNPYDITSNERLFEEISALGVEIYFIVYDILPLLHPEFFPQDILGVANKWFETIAKVASGLVCISKSVADEVDQWLGANPPDRIEPLQIGYFHLGADIEKSASTTGIPEDAKDLFGAMESTPSFLMVGTVEPRKGHAQVLSAFDQLWSQNTQVNLIIVGQEGWKGFEPEVREYIIGISGRIRNHDQYRKRLFWLEGVSDEYLEKLYELSSALIMASEGEGFGLPIIEAARHNTPLILRDLPVFQEIAGRCATYFIGLEPDVLATAIANWLQQDAEGNTPSSNNIRFSSWTESANFLKNLLQDPTNPNWISDWKNADLSSLHEASRS